MSTESSEQMAACWARIRGRLREEVGEVEYRSWLRQMTLAGIDGDEAIVMLPTRFLRDWVTSHYGERLRVLWQSEHPVVRRLEIRVAPAAREPATLLQDGSPIGRTVLPEAEVVGGIGDTAAFDEAASAAYRPGLAEALVPRRADLRPPRASRLAHDPRAELISPLEPRFTFDSFVVGKPNEFAHACARRVAEQPASPGFNPLFLYGGVGLGKTHLMQAIAWSIRESHPGRSVAYMSAEKFMTRFIGALRSQNTMEFKDALRSVDVLLVDDVQFLVGKDNTQEEFFHTFNALVDAGKQIVISSDKPPSDLAGIEDRLRTRLGWGMVADLHATTYELRLSILLAKAAAADITVPTKVLELLAHRITTNVRELEGALNRLVAHAKLFGRPVTTETALDALQDVFRAHDRRVSIEEIQKRVAEHYNIRLADMSSARRARNVARPRQVAMYLAKQLTQRSLPEIGRRFGNRDHTTVMHAVSRIAELMQQDAGFAEDVALLRKMLET